MNSEKQTILEFFFSAKGMGLNVDDVFSRTTLKIQKFIRKYGEDNQLNTLLTVMDVHHSEHNSNFHKCCELSQPVIKAYENKESWDFYDIRLMTSVFSYVDSCDKALKNAEKILTLLKSYQNHERYIHIKIAIHSNSMLRMLRANFNEREYINAPHKLEYYFNAHKNELMRISSNNKSFKYLQIAADFRSGLFHGDFSHSEKILKQLKPDKSEFAKKVYKALTDEYLEYSAKLGVDLSKEQFAQIIGRKIRAYRVEKMMTLDELAELLDISTTYLGQIERGERQVSSHTLYRLAAILEVDLSVLFELEKKPFAEAIEPTKEDIMRRELTEMIDKLELVDLEAVGGIIRRLV